MFEKKSMPNTYTQIHIQAVFAVKFRAALLGDRWREEFHKYVTGIVRNQGHKMISINSVSDHVHVFFGMRPVQSLSDLMQDIKGDSSKWINQKRFIPFRFAWQESFAAFSYCRNEIGTVARYIENQQQHHMKESFLDEYRRMLRSFEVDYDEQFIFKEPV
jgi:REP element-mobilizing transposase RayT